MSGAILVKAGRWIAVISFCGLVRAPGQDTEPAPPPAKTFHDGTVLVESPGNTPKGTWKPHPTRLLELLDGYTLRQPPALDAYGGRLDQPGEKATGFFHTTKRGERWWLVDPDGHFYFNVAINTVAPFSGAGSPADTAPFHQKFGTMEVWRDKTLDFLHDTGFLGLGNWSDAVLRTGAQPLPYTIRKSFMVEFAKTKGLTLPASGHSGFVNDCFPVFLPDFPAFCDTYAKDLARTAGDPYVLGIFSDNELLAPAHLLDLHLALDVSQPNLKPGHDAAVAWLKARGTDPAAITDRDRHDFIAYVFERYYRIVSAAIKKYDPNHLYIGSRICFRKAQFSNAALWQAMGQYLDVISVNDYSTWGPDPVESFHWEAWSHKPVIITEWYAKALDVPGLANTQGAGWLVRTQEDRARFYQHFLLGCLESGSIVGAHFFKYRDDPSDSVALDSAGGANKGIVNIAYEPYGPLVTRARAVNRQVYPLIDFFDRRK